MTLIQECFKGHWTVTENNNVPTLSADAIEKHLYDAFEEYSRETYPSKHREHLGISVIGEDCRRRIWLAFRWAKLQQAPGAMRRLWQRGKDEEAKIERFLFWLGMKQRSVIDPATGDQHKASLINGHYGGSTDGIWIVTFANDVPVITEYKTHNKKSFDKLKLEGVKKSKAQHWAQMCGYGKEFKIKYGLYIAIHKDSDEIYFKFLELDWNYAIELEKKASDIIYAQTPPEKISQQASFWKCQYCHFQNICFFDEPVEKNCRSCIFASPADNGKWQCSKYGIIPNDFLAKGCKDHSGII